MRLGAADQIAAAVASLRQSELSGTIALEIVATAAETLVELMDLPATIEWCDHHGRPHEFCGMWEAAGAPGDVCTPRVRAVGPEVALWTT